MSLVLDGHAINSDRYTDTYSSLYDTIIGGDSKTSRKPDSDCI